MIVKGKILIIDDEIKVINALKRIFEKDKYEIISVTNPEKATKKMGHLETEF